MPRPKGYLSPRQWELMSIIWDMEGPVTVKRVMEIGFPDGEKAYTTVQTVMNILVDNGFLSKEKLGPINIYSPLIQREEATTEETAAFMEKVFNGSFQKMANFMLGRDSLTDEELRHLKDLIRQREDEETEHSDD